MAKISDIIVKLIERTIQGKVRWKTSAGKDTFVAVIGNSSVMVSKEVVTGVEMQILDKSGQEIYQIGGSLSGRESLVNRENLEELHEMARRAALGVDAQLDELMATLDGS